MTIDTSVPRSRRALLAGGLGSLAALAAAALGRPLPTSAADGQAVLVGGEYTASSVTRINTGTTGATALMGTCGSNPAGIPRTGLGVYGYSNSASGAGVHGEGVSGKGVIGTSESGAGVFGWSTSSMAVWGLTNSGRGVVGYSTSGDGIHGESKSQRGVYGYSASTTGVHGAGGGTGVLGTCEKGWGVHGASDSNWGVVGRSRTGGGVHGQSTAGDGVYGQATSGTGLYGTATTGYAIRSSGRVRLDKASGVATIAATGTSIVVTPGIDVTSTSFVLLTPKADLGTRRLWYSTNATTNEITIRVSSAVTADLKVGWLLLG